MIEWILKAKRTLAAWGWWAVAIAAVVAFLVIWGLLTWGGRQKERAVQAGADRTFATARAQSSGEAIATQDAALNAAAAGEALSKESSDAIHNAPGANAPLSPDLNRVGHDRLCKREAYRNRPECLLGPGRANPSR